MNDFDLPVRLIRRLSAAQTPASSRRPLRRASRRLSLEQRFMFDGAAVATAAHAAEAKPDAHDAALAAQAVAAHQVREADASRNEGKKEVVFVDTSLPDYKTLEAGVRDGMAIVEFDGSQDGLAQIAGWAQSHGGYDAIHILSHGSEGTLNLGAGPLTEASLSSATVQAELAEIGHALNAGGDLLLYGCDVAAGSDGQQFIDDLARLTGADVAASTDATGAADLGGDWTLEAHVGQIDARALSVADYQRLLTVVTFTDLDADYSSTTISKTINGETVTFTGGTGFGGMGVDTSYGSEGLYSYEGTGGGNDIKLTISIAPGYMFDISSFDAGVASGSLAMTVIYADGSSANLSRNGLFNAWQTLSGFGTSLSHATEIVLSSSDFGLFQNFDIINVRAIPSVPVVNDSHISITSTGTGTGGAYKIGDTVTAVWNNTAAGDNNAEVDSVTMDFSQFGGGSAVTATNLGGIWTASYTITAGSVDAFNRNVSVRAVNAGGGVATADTTNLSVDNAPPVVTDGRIGVSGATGTGGAYKVGDTVSVTWNNTAGGDNNADVSSVTVDFSQFGGSSAVAATNSGGIWTATYTIVSGNIDSPSRNVSVAVTDNAGNATTTADTSSSTVDNIVPTVTDASIGISGGSGAGGAYKTGDTATVTWNNTAAGDNNADVSSVTVDFSQFGGPSAVAASNSGGTWTATYTIVSGTFDGLANRNVSVAVTDNAGNVRTTADTSNAVVDNVAPTNTIASVSFSNDTGASGSDFITNAAAQTVSGTLSANLSAGETVYVSLNNGTTWTAASAAVGQNSWSLSGVTLTGSNTLRVMVSDAAGNNGAVLAQAYVYDTVAPATAFSNLAFSNDTGTAGDFVTNAASQTVSATLSGALAPGDILYGSLDNGQTWIDITSKVSGTALSWNGVTLSGSNTLQLKVADAAGNESAVRSQAYTLDVTPPATPSTPALDAASDSGASSSDRVTNDNTPTFTGAAESGSTVKIYDGATLLGSVVAAGGVWSYTSGTLSDGSHNITAVATDMAGNVSAASAAAVITVDTAAPAVTSVSVPANATYHTGDAMDFTVNFDEAVTVDTSGGTPRIALVIGSTTRYAVYVSGSGTSALVFRYTVANGDVDSNGITVGALASDGGTLKDQAGNLGDTTLNSVGSTAAVLVDGSQASITNISASTADGSYGAGSTITITVDFSAAVNVDTSGGTPTLALSSGGNATYSGGSGTSTLTFSYTVGAGENSADLDYSSTSALALNGATIKDAGGNQNAAVALAAPGAAGSLGANKNIDIDTTAPAITGNTVVFSADTGSSSSDLITNTSLQTISGTLTGSLSSGDLVQISLDNGMTWTTATSAGSAWSLAVPVILTVSDTLQVRVVDAAGNIGSAASYAYVLDTTAPGTTFSNIALSADTGVSSSDFITNTSAQTISATLSAAMAAGDRLYGSLDNGSTWTDLTAKVSGTTLTWDNVTLGGSDTLQFRVMDAAGNYGAATSKAYVLDTTAPATTVASAAFSNDSGNDFNTHVAAQTISGTLSANVAAGETVYVSLDNGGSWQAATAAVGQAAWSLGGQTLSASDTLLVKVSDAAGNDGTVYSHAYVYEAVPPSPPAEPPVAPSTPVLLVPPPPPVVPVVMVPPDAGRVPMFSPSIEPVAEPGPELQFLPAGLETTLQSSPLSGALALLGGMSDSGRTVLDMSAHGGDAGGAGVPASLQTEGLILSRGMDNQVMSLSGHTEISVPSDAFEHTDPNAVLQLSARQPDGRPLPSWVRFDSRAGKFIIDPPKGMQGEISIQIIARDGAGHESTLVFRVRLGDRQAQAQPAYGGRAGLSEQLHLAARQRTGGVLDRLARLAGAWPNA